MLVVADEKTNLRLLTHKKQTINLSMFQIDIIPHWLTLEV